MVKSIKLCRHNVPWPSVVQSLVKYDEARYPGEVASVDEDSQV